MGRDTAGAAKEVLAIDESHCGGEDQRHNRDAYMHEYNTTTCINKAS
jgi:hypothetical protein